MRLFMEHDKADEVAFWLQACDRLLWERNSSVDKHIAKLMHCLADGMTPQEAVDWCMANGR